MVSALRDPISRRLRPKGGLPPINEGKKVELMVQVVRDGNKGVTFSTFTLAGRFLSRTGK